MSPPRRSAPWQPRQLISYDCLPREICSASPVGRSCPGTNPPGRRLLWVASVPGGPGGVCASRPGMANPMINTSSFILQTIATSGREFGRVGKDASLDSTRTTTDSPPLYRRPGYVCPFPGPGQRRRIGARGTNISFPYWRKDGIEILFYSDGDLMSVGVTWLGGNPSFAESRKLFSGLRRGHQAWVGTRPLAASRNGWRIYWSQSPDPSASNGIQRARGRTIKINNSAAYLALERSTAIWYTSMSASPPSAAFAVFPAPIVLTCVSSNLKCSTR